MSSGWGPGSAAGSGVGASSSSVSSSSSPLPREGAVVVVLALGEGAATVLSVAVPGASLPSGRGVGSIDRQSNRSRLPVMMGSRLEESSPIADRWQPPEASLWQKTAAERLYW
jgi:hypothetical protein